MASSDDARALDLVLGHFDADDRVAALAVSLITRKPQGAFAVLSLMSLIQVMTPHLGLTTEEQIVISERMRDLADQIEYARRERVKA